MKQSRIVIDEEFMIELITSNALLVSESTERLPFNLLVGASTAYAIKDKNNSNIVLNSGYYRPIHVQGIDGKYAKFIAIVGEVSFNPKSMTFARGIIIVIIVSVTYISHTYHKIVFIQEKIRNFLLSIINKQTNGQLVAMNVDPTTEEFLSGYATYEKLANTACVMRPDGSVDPNAPENELLDLVQFATTYPGTYQGKLVFVMSIAGTTQHGPMNLNLKLAHGRFTKKVRIHEPRTISAELRKKLL
jgi:hypothetical protein